MATTRITVTLDLDDYGRLEELARREGRSVAELAGEAIAEYARGRTGATPAHSIGAGRSGGRDLSERAEELLQGLGRGA